MNKPVTELSWVDSSGASVVSAVPTPDVAAHVLTQLEDADRLASMRRADVKAIADNNPPYVQAELDAKNLGYMTNLSFREMGAMLDQRAGQSFDLLQGVPQLVTILLRGVSEDPEGDDVQPRTRHEDIIAEEFTTLLQDWHGFVPMMDFVRRQADLFGVGTLMWRDEWDWRPIQVARGALFPSPYATVVVDDWTLTGISDTMTAHELLKIVEDPMGEATREGWNIEAVKEHLAKLYAGEEPKSSTNNGPAPAGTSLVSPWERFQQRLRLNEPSVVSRMFESVNLRHLYVKEPKGGKYSHYILPGDLNTAGGWLYARANEFDKLSEHLWILPFNYGDGLLKTIRSIADMTMSFFDISNRFLGRILDAGFTRGTLLLQATSPATDPRKVQLARQGIVTLIPMGVTLMQASTYTPPIMEMAQIRELTVTVMKNNVGVRTMNPETATGGSQRDVSAREVAENVSREARIEQSSVALDYVQYDILYRELMRRVLKLGTMEKPDLTLPGAKEAADFVMRCRTRGVPDEYLAMDRLDVKAFRAIGLGSWSARKDISQMVYGMRGSFDAHGQINAVRDLLAVLVGPRHVNRYKAPLTRDDIPSNVQSLAQLENNDLRRGESCVVGTDQQHTIHVATHAALVVEIVKAVQESGGRIQDPAPLLAALDAALPHMQEHLQMLAEDPAQEQFIQQVDPLIKAALQVRGYLVQLAEQIQKAQERAAAEQQKMLEEAQGIVNGVDSRIKLLKAQQEVTTKANTAASLINMRVARQQANEEMDRRRVESTIALKNRESDAMIEIKRRLAEAEAENKRLTRQQATAGG